MTDAVFAVQVLSVSIDFYVRVFVRVYTSPAVVKDSATKLAYIYQSKGCSSFFLQRVGRKVCLWSGGVLDILAASTSGLLYIHA